MRTSLKCLVFYLIVGVILLNLYFLGQLYFHNENNQENVQHQNKHQHSNDFLPLVPKQDELVNQASHKINSLKNSKEFLVLDWTGHQHIFREQDPIKCKFIFSNIPTSVAIFFNLQEKCISCIYT